MTKMKQDHIKAFSEGKTVRTREKGFLQSYTLALIEKD